MTRDAVSPPEIADLAGFSYHAVLRAIRRGDLEALEPVPGRLRDRCRRVQPLAPHSDPPPVAAPA